MFNWTGIIDLWYKPLVFIVCYTFCCLPEIGMEIDFVISSEFVNIYIRLYSISIFTENFAKKMALNYNLHIQYLFSSSSTEWSKSIDSYKFFAHKRFEDILSLHQCESITQSLNGNYPNGTHWHHSQLVKCWVNPLKPSVCTTESHCVCLSVEQTTDFLVIDCWD